MFPTELFISTNYQAIVTELDFSEVGFLFKNRTCMISKNGAKNYASRVSATKLPPYNPSKKSNEAAASLLILKVLKLHVSSPPGTTDYLGSQFILKKKKNKLVLQCFFYLV